MNSFSAAPEPESQRIFSFYPQRRTPSRSGRRKATTASLISEKGELRHRAGLLGTPVGRATQNSVGRENHFTAEGPQLEKRRTCMFRSLPANQPVKWERQLSPLFGSGVKTVRKAVCKRKTEEPSRHQVPSLLLLGCCVGAALGLGSMHPGLCPGAEGQWGPGSRVQSPVNLLQLWSRLPPLYPLPLSA